MLTVYIDTEFNGFNGQLISMALVGEDGSEFYEVLECTTPVPWVAQHVMPFLEKEPVDFNTFQAKLQNFLYFHHQEIKIVADWPDDIKYFCESLIVSPGVAIGHPPITFVLDRTLSSGASKVPHNALHDARAIADQHMSKDYV